MGTHASLRTYACESGVGAHVGVDHVAIVRIWMNYDKIAMPRIVC